MNGWRGNILWVNLNEGTVESKPLDPQVAKDYIGGRGLGIYYLNELVDPQCDPLSPDNVLVMATGPLTGTGAPTGARYMVMTKSPLSGAITCSNSGGMFPTEFKRTGYDAIIFTGRSATPVYLYLDHEKAELRGADHLWGKDTHQTTELLLAETDAKARVACIGPAGEKRVLFAAIMNDKHRAAGRSGVGAVMGSKNLKAVVVKGKGRIPLADPDRFKTFNKQILDTFQEGVKVTPLGLTVNGTAGVVMVTQNFGVLPTKNWQQGTFDGWEKIHGEELTRRFLKKNSACYGCPIGCGRKTRVDDPHFAGQCLKEAVTLYELGKRKEGFQQGNSFGAPYRYGEETWADDMEWGAAELYKTTGEKPYLEDAIRYARMAGTVSWMPYDTARHYQYYPFVNMGHYALYDAVDESFKDSLAAYYRAGIESCLERAGRNPYRIGVSFIWCSNNLLTSLMAQMILYEEMTGDERYRDFLLLQRDWLFGRNPWGTSMFTGIPEGGEYPVDVHTSVYAMTGREVAGGLIDGPVYGTIYRSLAGLVLNDADEFASVQNPFVVYHDDMGDYSTNEPTMDGTAGAILMMAHFATR